LLSSSYLVSKLTDAIPLTFSQTHFWVFNEKHICSAQVYHVIEVSHVIEVRNSLVEGMLDLLKLN